MDKKEKGWRTKAIICDIDNIISKKMENLTGYGLQTAVTTLEDIYRFKKTDGSQIAIFDKMAELCRTINASETKGKQQQLCS